MRVEDGHYLTVWAGWLIFQHGGVLSDARVAAAAVFVTSRRTDYTTGLTNVFFLCHLFSPFLELIPCLHLLKITTTT